LVLFAKYNYGGQIEENVMGRVCSTSGRDEMHTKFKLENVKENIAWETHHRWKN
jgi:hypothetical protein